MNGEAKKVRQKRVHKNKTMVEVLWRLNFYPINRPTEIQFPAKSQVFSYPLDSQTFLKDQCGVQHLAILAFWYVLLGVAQRKKSVVTSFKNRSGGLVSKPGLGIQIGTGVL